MKFSVSWLREWLSAEPAVDKLMDDLTMAGLEVDKSRSIASGISGVYVGQVRQIKPHPQADRLQICSVDVGTQSLLQIVCGAKNVYEGMYAPVAIVGARLGGLEIIQQTIRGVQSEGMLCSAGELGLAYETDGLLDLGDEVPAGSSLDDYLWLGDTVAELDLTPNRADCFSIKGVAREVMALEGGELAAGKPSRVADDHDKNFPINVTANEACPRYLARVLTGLNPNAVTPIHIKERLCRSGIRPIHPVVDVMNYVMLELGQPLHAFDLSKLDDELNVRFADEGEQIRLLDGGREVCLSDDTLVIASDKRVLAIAGIIGGDDSAVSDSTQDILIECAFFTPAAIVGKARTYGLHTEASRRFERGVDFNLQRDALEYACEMLARICGGQFGPITEVVSEKHIPKPEPIELRYEEINKRLGIEVGRSWVQKALRSLEIKVKSCKGGWICYAPSHRFDLTAEVDLIEEVGRLHGYDNVLGRLPQVIYAPPSESAEKRRMLSSWCDKLTAQGYLEVITYSFGDPDLFRAIKRTEIRELSNPISPSLSAMRTSLWSGLLNVLKYNLNHQQTRLRIFEMGNQFLSSSAEPNQSMMLAGLTYGATYPEQWGITQAESTEQTNFYDLKADLRGLLAPYGDRICCRAETDNPALHPGKAARILLDDTVVGCFGVLNPEHEERFDVPEGICLFELELDRLPAYSRHNYQPLSRYPSVRRDISMTVPEELAAADLLDCIRANKPDTLQNVYLFDVYAGEKIDKGRKSLAFGLIFQDFSATLGEQEVEANISKLIDVLSQQFEIQIRRK